jgi:hypothetical protein
LSVALGDVFLVLEKASSKKSGACLLVRNQATNHQGWVPASVIDTKEHWAITSFIEHALLPAINRQPPAKAHWMANALDALLLLEVREGFTCSGSDWYMKDKNNTERTC